MPAVKAMHCHGFAQFKTIFLVRKFYHKSFDAAFFWGQDPVSTQLFVSFPANSQQPEALLDAQDVR